MVWLKVALAWCHTVHDMQVPWTYTKSKKCDAKHVERVAMLRQPGYENQKHAESLFQPCWNKEALGCVGDPRQNASEAPYRYNLHPQRNKFGQRWFSPVPPAHSTSEWREVSHGGSVRGRSWFGINSPANISRTVKPFRHEDNTCISSLIRS